MNLKKYCELMETGEFEHLVAERLSEMDEVEKTF